MYIPIMAFTTYVLLSTLIAGLNGKFKPELLGITFSNASVIILLELVLLWLGRYFLNINSESQIYDLVAYSGYKFVGVIVTIAVAAIANRGQGTGGWVGWAVFGYTFMANAFFLVSLRYDPSHCCSLANKRSVAALPEVRTAALRLLARQPEHADDRPRTAEPEDAIPVRLHLCRAIRVHVVAQRAGLGQRQGWREVERNGMSMNENNGRRPL